MRVVERAPEQAAQQEQEPGRRVDALEVRLPLEARGGDPFRELSLPQAVLKLKQGFGRLVRSRADRGAILILDRRVLTKGYGRLFLESLPPARLVRGPLPEVLCAVAEACR